MATEEQKQNEHLHIFVNNRKFGPDNGVTESMTAGAIAGLIGVEAGNAIVRWDAGPLNGQEIPVTETVELKNGDHFKVTRKTVEGGHGG